MKTDVEITLEDLHNGLKGLTSYVQGEFKNFARDSTESNPR